MKLFDRAERARARGVVVSALAILGLGLGACSTIQRLNPFDRNDEQHVTASQGNRIPVIALNQQLQVSDTLRGQDFFLPPPAQVADWPLPGGNAEQSVEHIDAAPTFQVAWRAHIGNGSNRRAHITAPPIAAGGRLFVMDANATVSAVDAASGRTVWHTNLQNRTRRDREGWGGGLAFADGKLYVVTGYRQVVQVDAATGAVGWRTNTTALIHAAPTVANGRVFAVTVDDQLLTFDMATGQQGWNYQALTEPARLIGASSPAVSGDTVVAAFASGEVVALRTANGNDLWNEALSRESRTNALSEIRDIVGRPVIFHGDVYAISHSGAFSAIDLRTGSARWTLPIAGISTPWAAGDVVYVVSRAGEVICVARESGQVYWTRDLNEGRRRDRAVFTGPILASNRLVVVSSRGEATSLDPKTGAVQTTIRLGGRALISPIAFGGTIYVVTDNGEVVAIR